MTNQQIAQKVMEEFLVESVRRCLNAIDNGKPYRLTKEFDDLILLDDW